MSKLVQEKFQYEVPVVDTGYGNEWVPDASARRPKSGVVRQCLPPGTDIDAQEQAYIPAQPFAMSGATDVSRDWNPEAVANGYTRRNLRPTDDNYTREHNDAFYDDMTVDGETGFIERNNMLDRL